VVGEDDELVLRERMCRRRERPAQIRFAAADFAGDHEQRVDADDHGRFPRLISP